MNNIAKLFLILLFLGLRVDLFAQIDPELLLELKKGTTAEMNAITPAKGVLLYNTDDDKVYRYDGTSWASMGDDGDWTRNGNDQYSAVSGNVGIGTNNPQRLLHLSQDYPSGLTTLALENTNTTNGNSSIISFRTKTNGAGGTDFLETAAISAKYQEHDHATQSTDLMLWAKEAGAWSNAVLKGNGDFGIGTTDPVVHLSNNTSSIPANLEISTTGKTGVAGRTDLSLFSDMDGSNPANIFLQGKLSTGNYGWATWSFRGNHSLAEYKDWVDFGLNDGTATKEQVMRMNVLNGDVVFNEGNVGIGITSPTTKLHVMGDIQLGGSDKRLIRFRNLADNDHASIGELNGGLVLSGHSAANVAGSEHLFINNQGNVGIGTISPSGKLHVSSGTEGDAKLIIEADTDDNNEDDNPILVFKQDGGIEESAIEQTHNELHFRNSISSGGGLVFDVGTVNGYENSTEAMRVVPSGEVGIGTATPSEKLDIQGNVAHSGQLRSRGPNYTYPWMRFADHVWGNSTVIGAGGNTILGGGEFASTAQPNFGTSDETLVLGSDYNIAFFTNTQSGWADGKNVMNLTNSARVGINTDAPTVDLDVNGKLRIRDIPAGGGSQWLVKDANGNVKVQASDIRLKKNIVSIENSLDKVMALDGKYFDWKEDGRHDIGFVAQDVEKILPELVSGTDDGYKALNYPQITAVLVNAVKELKKENDILRKQVSSQISMSARVDKNGDIRFGDNSFQVKKIAKGQFFVKFKNPNLLNDYMVDLSTNQKVLPNGDPIYINLNNYSKFGFEIAIKTVSKGNKIAAFDTEWTFNLKGKKGDLSLAKANTGE